MSIKKSIQIYLMRKLPCLTLWHALYLLSTSAISILRRLFSLCGPLLIVEAFSSLEWPSVDRAARHPGQVLSGWGHYRQSTEGSTNSVVWRDCLPTSQDLQTSVSKTSGFPSRSSAWKSAWTSLQEVDGLYRKSGRPCALAKTPLPLPKCRVHLAAAVYDRQKRPGVLQGGLLLFLLWPFDI